MLKVVVLVVCGPPCSGKTTFVKSLRNKFEKCDGKKTCETNKIIETEKNVFIGKNDILKSDPFWNIVHLCYDDLMPFEINEDIITESHSKGRGVNSGDDENDEDEDGDKISYFFNFKTEKCSSFELTSQWKQHRQLILKLLDCLLQQLRQQGLSFNLDDFIHNVKDFHSDLKHAGQIINRFTTSIQHLSRTLLCNKTLKEQKGKEKEEQEGKEEEEEQEERKKEVEERMEEEGFKQRAEEEGEKKKEGRKKNEEKKGGREEGEGAKVLLVVDDNMWLRSMRQQVFKLARRYGFSFAQVYLTSSLAHLLMRNGRRSGGERVSEGTIVKMMTSFEEPRGVRGGGEVGKGGTDVDGAGNGTEESLSWEHFSISIVNGGEKEEEKEEKERNEEKVEVKKKEEKKNKKEERDKRGEEEEEKKDEVEYPLNDVLKLLNDSLQHPFSPPTQSAPPLESRTICLNNLLHQADLILRKCVKEILSEVKNTHRSDKTELQRRARQTSLCKLEVLDDVRNHRFLWPLPTVDEITDASNQPESSIYRDVQKRFEKKILSLNSK